MIDLNEGNSMVWAMAQAYHQGVADVANGHKGRTGKDLCILFADKSRNGHHVTLRYAYMAGRWQAELDAKEKP